MNSLKDKILAVMVSMLKMTCRDTSPLISEMMDHDVALWKRLRVKIHLKMCDVCQHYQNQLLVLRHACRAMGTKDYDGDIEITLSPHCKKKIQQSLKR